MNRLVISLVAAVLSAIAFTQGAKLAGLVDETDADISAELEREVDKMRKDLPMKVHPLVTWFDVASMNNRLVYKYRVSVPRGDLFKGRKQMEQMVTSEMKRNWMYKSMETKGIDVGIEVYDTNSQFAFSFQISGNSAPTSRIVDKGGWAVEYVEVNKSQSTSQPASNNWAGPRISKSSSKKKSTKPGYIKNERLFFDSRRRHAPLIRSTR